MDPVIEGPVCHYFEPSHSHLTSFCAGVSGAPWGAEQWGIYLIVAVLNLLIHGPDENMEPIHGSNGTLPTRNGAWAASTQSHTRGLSSRGPHMMELGPVLLCMLTSIHSHSTQVFPQILGEPYRPDDTASGVEHPWPIESSRLCGTELLNMIFFLK